MLYNMQKVRKSKCKNTAMGRILSIIATLLILVSVLPIMPISAGNELPDQPALEDFLKRFSFFGSTFEYDSDMPDYMHYSGKTYRKYFYGLLNCLFFSNPIDYSKYPGEKERQSNSYSGSSENYISSDPRGWAKDASIIYSYSSDKINWIARNIFNCSDENIDEMTRIGEDIGKYYIENGRYYYITEGIGGVTYVKSSRIKEYEYNDDWFNVKYELDIFSGTEFDRSETHIAKMQYKEIDGQYYWTMYQNNLLTPVDFQVSNGVDRTIDLKWDWANFDRSADDYNCDLALSGLCLSKAIEVSEYDIKNMMSSIGFDGVETYNFREFNIDNPAVCFGYKQVCPREYTTGIDSSNYIIGVIIRGTTSLGDKITDVSSLNNGFIKIGKNIELGLNAYIEKINKKNNYKINDSNTKYFITGHSLGGAAAGTLETLNLREGKANSSDRFIYTFASPNYETDQYHLEDCSNVHNIINENDLIPTLPWGFKRLNFQNDIRFNSHNYIDVLDDLEGICSEIDEHMPVTYLAEHNPVTYLAYLLGNSEGQDENLTNPFLNISIYHCPIDIEVYNSDGEKIAWSNGSEIHNSDNLEVILLNDEDGKILYSMNNADVYTVKITGTGEGYMQYTQQIANPESYEIIDEKCFENVAISEGKILRHTIGNNQNPDTHLYVVKNNEDGNEEMCEVHTNGKEGFYIDEVFMYAVIFAVFAVICTILGLIFFKKFKKHKI